MKPDAAPSRAIDVESIARRLLEVAMRQAQAPQYSERVAHLRKRMADRKVSPEIIERVIRLNPDLREGYRLRGIHYKGHIEQGWGHDWITRGRAIRERGRAWLDSLPAEYKRRRGKRQYVTREAWQDFAPSAAQ